MKKIIDIARKRLEEGKGSVLVTFVKNEGSAPGHTGSVMLVGEEGYLAGTIGGGMLEYKAAQEAQNDLKMKQSTLRRYCLNKDEIVNLGMVCGGIADILFKVVLPCEETRRLLDAVQTCLTHYEKGSLAMSLEGEEVAFINDNGDIAGLAEGKLPEIGKSMGENSYLLENSEGKKFLVISLENTSKVFIFGGGHLAQELVPLISHLGFRCIVTDDREEFSNRILFPQAEELHIMDFDRLDGKFDIHEQDYIIAVTRGHMGDYNVEKFALRTPAHYIGVVGSRSKTASVNKMLRSDGFSDADIARIVTPIGINILSKTPAEIAVSIAAQLIEKRALYQQRKLRQNL